MTMSVEKSTRLVHGIIEFGLMIDNSETVSEAAEKIVTAIINANPSVLAPVLPEPNDQEQWITDGYVIEPVQDGSGDVLITSTGDESGDREGDDMTLVGWTTPPPRINQDAIPLIDNHKGDSAIHPPLPGVA